MQPHTTTPLDFPELLHLLGGQAKLPDLSDYQFRVTEDPISGLVFHEAWRDGWFASGNDPEELADMIRDDIDERRAALTSERH